MADNIWADVLERLRATIDPDEFRRWFSASSQASDSGDQITVWVTQQNEVRHIDVHYADRVHRELAALGRPNVSVRFVATGYEDEDRDDVEE
jgi:chromosomal replication initiation ATPase DnaA